MAARLQRVTVGGGWLPFGPGRAKQGGAPRSRQRGFTLVELMVVVVIVGVLATIGVSLLRNYVFSSRTTEVVAMIQGIRAAEEAFRAENQVYLDVSTTLTSFYPTATPGKTRYAWKNPSGNDYQNWRLLNPTNPGDTQFGYAVKAGGRGDALPTPNIEDKPTWATPMEPWYVIQAVADVDEDEVRAYFVATSMSAEVYSENEGE